MGKLRKGMVKFTYATLQMVFFTQYDKRRKRYSAYLPFNETQREKPYSVQEFVKKILATSDLFDMFIQSIKFN